MPKIKIDPNRVNDLSTKERNIKNKTDDCQASVGTVINNLDWKVSSRSSIDTRLNNVKKRLQKQTELTDAYIRALGTVNDTFGNKDRKLKQDAKNLIYQMNSISAALALAGKALTKVSYRTDDKLRKLLGISELFGRQGISGVGIAGVGVVGTGISGLVSATKDDESLLHKFAFNELKSEGAVLSGGKSGNVDFFGIGIGGGVEGGLLGYEGKIENSAKWLPDLFQQ